MLEWALPHSMEPAPSSHTLETNCPYTQPDKHPRIIDMKEMPTAASSHGNFRPFILPYLVTWTVLDTRTNRWLDKRFESPLDPCKCYAASSLAVFPALPDLFGSASTRMQLQGKTWWLWMQRLLRHKILCHALPLFLPLTGCYLIAPDSISAQSRA